MTLHFFAFIRTSGDYEKRGTIRRDRTPLLDGVFVHSKSFDQLHSVCATLRKSGRDIFIHRLSKNGIFRSLKRLLLL